jgi:hypothetical protein
MYRRAVCRLSAVALIAFASVEASPLHGQPATAAQQGAVIPDTPAGRLFKAWLDVFDSGDSSRLDAFYKKFSYNLKMLKRATIVGETTGGGAHPVAGRRIDDHFMIGVPAARAINPISKTNWEGVGVEPDVKVAAVDALATAQKLATEKIKP